MSSINFFCEDVLFSLPDSKKTTKWIQDVIKREGKTLKEINYVFCTDELLLEKNIQYLNHHTYTDIITFDNSENKELIEGDIFISLDRVFENALNLNRPFLEELHRVIIHGTLHLLGYKDKKSSEKKTMREKEDACLALVGVPRETFF